MRRFAVPGVLTVVVVALLTLLAFGVSHEGTTTAFISQVKAGKNPAAPQAHTRLQVLGSATEHQALSSFRGKVVMINFYAGWCDSCQYEAPLLRKAEQMLKAHGGTVLGVTFQDSSSDALSYLSRYHLSFPSVRDPTGSFAQAYEVTQVPQTYIISPEGKVEAETFVITKSWLTKHLNPALGLST